jgi:uncharacterized membrane protein YtjA (UPF0391 family)
MLHWAAVFLVIALIAALFGFGGIAAGAASIAKVLFVLFIILALVAFVVGRRAPMLSVSETVHEERARRTVVAELGGWAGPSPWALGGPGLARKRAGVEPSRGGSVPHCFGELRGETEGQFAPRVASGLAIAVRHGRTNLS